MFDHQMCPYKNTARLSVSFRVWLQAISEATLVLSSFLKNFLHFLLLKHFCQLCKTLRSRDFGRNTPFNVILSRRPASPEDFLNESGVTFQQTKASTRPDEPVDSLLHALTRSRLWPQTLIIPSRFLLCCTEDNKDTLSG